jgi:hypothetical protein
LDNLNYGGVGIVNHNQESELPTSDCFVNALAVTAKLMERHYSYRMILFIFRVVPLSTVLVAAYVPI